MPALQSVVLTDRTPVTPVNLTLSPVGDVRKVGGSTIGKVAVGDASGNLLSEKALTIGSRRTAGRFRATMRIAIPVVVTETLNGVAVPRVVRTNYLNLEGSFALDSTEQERTDIVGMLASALGTTKVLVHDTFVKGQAVW